MNKLFDLKFGSHLYGTDTPNSDLDFKGIYLPTAREIVLGNYKKTISTTRPKSTFERNTKDDVDIEIFSLDRFLDLLMQGQTVALDVLFAPQHMYTSISDMGISVMTDIRMNRLELLSKNVNAFVGYAKQQAAKYGQKGFRIHGIRSTLDWLKTKNYNDTLASLFVQSFINELKNEHVFTVDCKAPNGKTEPHLEVCDRKYPFHARVGYIVGQLQKRFDEYGKRALLAETNEGVDWKALSHAVRVNSQAKELLETGNITFPRPDRQLLLDIKTGKMDYKDVANIIEVGLEQLHVAKDASQLKEEPNREWSENFVYDIYSEIVKNA